jgi:O-antigen ligase
VLGSLSEEGFHNAYFRRFIVFSIPAALIGIEYGGRRSIAGMIKWLDVFYLIMLLSLVFSLPSFYASLASAEIYYSQTVSYNAAIVLLFSLFLLDKKNNSIRFHFTHSPVYRAFLVASIPLMLYLVIISGGRGGFITLLVGFLVFVYIQGSSQKKTLFLLAVIGILITLFFQNRISASSGELLSRSIGRIFSYISNGQIDLSETSGRDLILYNAVNLIIEKPIWGYGLFDYLSHLGTYPHNVFIEWLLQGGVILFLFTIVSVFFITKKFYYILKTDPACTLLLPLFIFPATQLLFSGTWLAHPQFWFCTLFVINYRLNQSKA